MQHMLIEEKQNRIYYGYIMYYYIMTKDTKRVLNENQINKSRITHKNTE